MIQIILGGIQSNIGGKFDNPEVSVILSVPPRTFWDSALK
jgi:hypothetical protein